MNRIFDLTDSEVDLIGYCLCVTRGKLIGLIMDHEVIITSSCRDNYEEKLRSIKSLLDKLDYKDFLGV